MNLKERMCKEHYLYHEGSRNITEALAIIERDMKDGKPYSEFCPSYGYSDSMLALDGKTVSYLKENGFTVKRRLSKEECSKYSYVLQETIIVSWDEYDTYSEEVEYV